MPENPKPQAAEQCGAAPPKAAAVARDWWVGDNAQLVISQRITRTNAVRARNNDALRAAERPGYSA
jgi:hypothetical protein